MLAEIGKRYAIIQNGLCHWKFDISTLPEWADSLHVVEIEFPEPDEGDLFDGVAFTKPPVVPQPRAQDVVDAVLALPPERLALLKATLAKP
jgi:hypothetical protein